MPFQRLLAASFAAALLLLAAPATAAPTISFPAFNPTRTSPNNDQQTRQQNQLPNGISYDDCVKDVTMHFPVTATGFVSGADTLQVWAGPSDCSDKAARIGTTGTCQPVSVSYGLSASFTVDIKARDLVYASLANMSPPGSGGIVPLTTQPDGSVCSKRTASAGTPMNVLFLVFPAGGGADAETSLAFNPTTQGLGITVDTVGPEVPTQSKVDVGDTLLKLSWTPASDVTDTAGFTVFCDPPPGKELNDAAPGLPDGAATTMCVDASTPTVDSAAPALDASVDADDGAISDATSDAEAAAAPDASGTPDSSTTADASASTCTTPTQDGGAVCYSPVIQPNINGSAIASIQGGYYVCATTSDKTSTKAQIDGLTNGKQYTFGVAASDLIGNTGAVLVFPCSTPQLIDDFWHNYKASGGGAGGSFCALDAVGMPVEAPIMAGTFIVAAVVLVRRRRSR